MIGPATRSLVLAGMLASLLLVMVGWGFEPFKPLGFVIAATSAGALWLAMWWQTSRIERIDAGHILGFAAIAVTLRWGLLALAGDSFPLSDDVYRYLWDGKMLANGINPFALPPLASELQSLRDNVVWPFINHPHLPTIYPPAAQLVFWGTYSLFGLDLMAMKLVLSVFEIATLAILWIWMRRSGIEPTAWVAFALCPLLIIEFTISTHLDVIGLPFLIGTWLVLFSGPQRRPFLAGMLFGVAVLVKFLALIFAPLLLWELRRRELVAFIVGAATTVVALYAPLVILGGFDVFGSLGTYLAQWHANGSLAYVFIYLFGQEVARWLSAVLLIGWVAWHAVRRGDVYERLLWTFAGFVVLSPTIFPWYLIWALPLVVARPLPPFVWLAAIFPITYDVLVVLYATGEWTELWYIRLLVYLPFFGLLLFMRRWPHTWGIPRYA